MLNIAIIYECLSHKVLSESVSKAFSLMGGSKAAKTARFVGPMDKVFDCVNIHNYTHQVCSRKIY